MTSLSAPADARPSGCPDPVDVRSVVPDVPDPADVRVVPLARPGGCSIRAVGPDLTVQMFHAVPLDLQSRPIEYKDFQSAKAMN